MRALPKASLVNPLRSFAPMASPPFNPEPGFPHPPFGIDTPKTERAYGQSRRIINHFQDPYHLGTLTRPTHRAVREFPICEAPERDAIANRPSPTADPLAKIQSQPLTPESGIAPESVIAQARPASNKQLPDRIDRVQIELLATPDGTISEAWFLAEGCILSQASASILVEKIEGMTIDEAKAISAEAMLELVGDCPGLSRQRCLLLPWRALQTALDCPLSYDDDEGTHRFGGPSLEEEG